MSRRDERKEGGLRGLQGVVYTAGEIQARRGRRETEKAAGVGWMDFQPRIDNNCLNQARSSSRPFSSRVRARATRRSVTRGPVG